MRDKIKINAHKSLAFIIAMLLAIPFTMLLIPATVKATSSVYYVATNGNDNNNGTSLSAPFKTIQKAASLAVAGDTVNIRAGTYRETVAPANSGTSGNPITFQAYQNEEVLISGLDTVNTSWTQYSGNIYYTNYTMSMGDKDAAFVDGDRMTYARWPNETGTAPMTKDGAVIDSGSLTSIYDADMPNQSAGWYNGAIVWCIAAAKWYAWGTTITNSGNGTINFTIPDGSCADMHDPNDTSRGDRNYYFLSGKLGLLDVEKEYSFRI